MPWLAIRCDNDLDPGEWIGHPGDIGGLAELARQLALIRRFRPENTWASAPATNVAFIEGNDWWIRADIGDFGYVVAPAGLELDRAVRIQEDADTANSRRKDVRGRKL